MVDPVHIGDATLYCADCRLILPTLTGVDAVVTDPPYGVGADKNLRANKQHGNAVAPSRDYGLGDWDSSTPSQELLDAIILGNKAIIWGGNYFQFKPSACWLVWDKDNGDNGYADCELAWTNLDGAVRKYRHRWMGMLQENMGRLKEERLHPTQKPIPLMAWCIGFTQGTILDPFMGSGTTGVACARLGRKFIGVEISEPYFRISCERIKREYDQMKLFPSIDISDHRDKPDLPLSLPLNDSDGKAL